MLGSMTDAEDLVQETFLRWPESLSAADPITARIPDDGVDEAGDQPIGFPRACGASNM